MLFLFFLDNCVGSIQYNVAGKKGCPSRFSLDWVESHYCSVINVYSILGDQDGTLSATTYESYPSTI